MSSLYGEKWYENCIKLDSKYDIRLYYTIDRELRTIALRIQSSVSRGLSRSSGYVAVGLYPSQFPAFGPDHPSTSLTNARFTDLWGIGATSETNWIIGDYYMTGRSPNSDNNDLMNRNFSNNGTHIIGEFTRFLNTGDPKDQIIDTTKSYYCMYSCHPTKTISTNSIPEHLMLSGRAVACAGGPIISFGTSQSCDPPPVVASANGGGQWSSGSYTVSWIVDPTQTFFTFTMSVTGTGWIGMGYSIDIDGPAHSQSQMVIGWVSGGVTKLYDGYSNSKGTEVNGVTTISFQKPIKSTTPNSLDIPKGNVYFQYAYHTTQDGSGESFPQHQIRGSAMLNFFASGNDSVFIPHEVSPDIIFPSVQSNIFFDRTSGGILLLIVSVLIFLYSVVHYTREFIKYRFASHRNRSLVGPTGAHQVTKYKLKKRTVFHQMLNILNQRVRFLESPLTDVLMCIFYVLLAIGSVFIWGPEKEPISTALGYITSANSIFAVMTGLRNSILMWFLEIPFDRSIGFHRFLGYFSYIVVTVHAALFLIQWNSTIFIQMQSQKTNMFGGISWACFTFLVVGSLPYFRRRHFNSFYHAHIVLFLGFFFFAYMHSEYFTNYGLGFLVLYGLDRIIRFRNGLFPRKTIHIEYLAGEAVKIRIQREIFLKKYQVGQYVFVNFPGFKFFEWHPFTISSSPSEEYLEIVIRGLGEFTKNIVQFAKDHPQENIYVRVDGPYGKWPFNPKRYKTVVLVAGGVGVTPCISMLREVFHKNAAAHNIEMVYLIWSCPDESNLVWFKSEIESIEQMTGKEIRFIKDIYLTRTNELPKNTTGVSLGRPNIEALFQTIYTREVEARQGMVSRVAVISCGPTELVNTTWDISARMSKDMVQFDFHHEKFEF